MNYVQCTNTSKTIFFHTFTLKKVLIYDESSLLTPCRGVNKPNILLKPIQCLSLGDFSDDWQTALPHTHTHTHIRVMTAHYSLGCHEAPRATVRYESDLWLTRQQGTCQANTRGTARGWVKPRETNGRTMHPGAICVLYGDSELSICSVCQTHKQQKCMSTN